MIGAAMLRTGHAVPRVRSTTTRTGGTLPGDLARTQWCASVEGSRGVGVEPADGVARVVGEERPFGGRSSSRGPFFRREGVEVRARCSLWLRERIGPAAPVDDDPWSVRAGSVDNGFIGGLDPGGQGSQAITDEGAISVCA